MADTPRHTIELMLANPNLPSIARQAILAQRAEGTSEASILRTLSNFTQFATSSIQPPDEFAAVAQGTASAGVDQAFLERIGLSLSGFNGLSVQELNNMLSTGRISDADKTIFTSRITSLGGTVTGTSVPGPVGGGGFTIGTAGETGSTVPTEGEQREPTQQGGLTLSIEEITAELRKGFGVGLFDSREHAISSIKDLIPNPEAFINQIVGGSIDVSGTGDLLGGGAGSTGLIGGGGDAASLTGGAFSNLAFGSTGTGSLTSGGGPERTLSTPEIQSEATRQELLATQGRGDILKRAFQERFGEGLSGTPIGRRATRGLEQRFNIGQPVFDFINRGVSDPAAITQDLLGRFGSFAGGEQRDLGQLLNDALAGASPNEIEDFFTREVGAGDPGFGGISRAFSAAIAPEIAGLNPNFRAAREAGLRRRFQDRFAQTPDQFGTAASVFDEFSRFRPTQSGGF